MFLFIIVETTGAHPSKNTYPPFFTWPLMLLLLIVTARLSVVQSPWIKLTTSLYNNPKTPPPATKIQITANNPHRLYFRDWCAWVGDICLFCFKGRVTSFIAGSCCKIGPERGES